jgi:hypothetical protein
MEGEPAMTTVFERQRYLVAKFNIVLELGPLDGGEPVRVLAAFALIPETKRIRLLTLFG